MSKLPEDTRIARRHALTAGGAAVVGAAAAVSGASPAQAFHNTDPATPITDSLKEEHTAHLTDAARQLTEGDAVQLNQHLRNPESALPDHLEHLTLNDVDSLHKAFQNAHMGVFDFASLAPGMVGTARAGDACCCCTPASCCCAAAQTSPSRSRRIA